MDGGNFCPVEKKCTISGNYEIDNLSYLRNNLNTKKCILKTIGVEGKGSCFYHSVLYALNYRNFKSAKKADKKKMVTKFRKNVAKHISQSWDSFWKRKVGFVPINRHYITKEVNNYTSWATTTVIAYVMYKIKKINIIFLEDAPVDSSSSKRIMRFYCGMSNPNAKRTIFIHWVNRKHFQPLGVVCTNGKEKTVFKTKSKQVQKIMDSYKTICSHTNLKKLMFRFFGHALKRISGSGY